jgi:hypothetical protein
MKNIFLLLALLILLACNVKQPNKSNPVITYGTSFGMCIGYCKKQIKINSSTIIYTANKNQPDTTPVSCNKMPDTQLMETLQKSVDTTKFAALPAVIGCPDCADGGKEWIEIENNGKKQKVEFEFGNPPAELKEIVAQLKPILNSFKEDCK